MAGYSRQSVADIIANAVIKAAPVNAEFNAIRDAFAFSGGHKHDGTSTEGAYIPLIADVDANNKVVVDTTNNRISFFVEVSGSPVEQLRIQDGKIVPVTDNDIDLGAVGAEFKDVYVNGIGYIDNIQVHENAVITGNLTVNGNTTIGNANTDTVTINADVASNLIPDLDSTRSLGDSSNYWSHTYTDAVTTTGAATVGGALTVTGLSTLPSVDINAGAIDGTTVGFTSPTTGKFTTATANSFVGPVTGNVTGNLTGNVTGNVTGNLTGNVTSTGISTFTTVDINGGAIDGTTIGATTPAAITGTTITGTSLVGPVTGNVTGNVVGNVTGNLTGNVTASIGSSTFNDVVINGTLNMDAGTAGTITNLTDPTLSQDAATKNYVDTSISNLIASAPGTLDTLNELAAALGDDPNFSTTITNSIATKLALTGGTMSGNIAMGGNKVTGLGTPTTGTDATNKTYVDGILGSATAAATSADLAQRYATEAENVEVETGTYSAFHWSQKSAASATAASSSETNAAASATSAATSETNAASSATAAASSATAAATSETNAATSATNAATSETNAATSASSASTSATSASSSATAASTSASNAATSETNAATSATNAATSETNAAASAAAAEAAALVFAIALG